MIAESAKLQSSHGVLKSVDSKDPDSKDPLLLEQKKIYENKNILFNFIAQYKRYDV